MSDEKYYLQATYEVENNVTNSMIWAKAETVTLGDFEKAKYVYIKLRVEQLKLGEKAAENQDAKGNVQSSNYFTRHWRGENSLIWSYWINVVGVNILMSLLVTVTDEISSESFQAASFIFALMILIYIWSLVGTWRSAGNYIQIGRKIPVKSPFWGYTARVMICLGVLQTYPLVHDAVQLYQVSGSDLNNQFYIEKISDTDIKLTGYINHSSQLAVKKSFLDDPNRTALIIESPGGLLSAAFDLADFIIENKIIVAVKDECASACLLILASSVNGVAGTNARLAFHDPVDTAEFISSEMQTEGELEVSDYYGRFLEYGIPPEVLNGYKELGWVDLSLGEAFNNNIINLIWEPETNIFHDPLEFCQNTDCFVTPVKITSSIRYVNVFDLNIGDCFNDTSVESEIITGIALIPCNTSHDNEVIAKFDLDAVNFPGDVKANEKGLSQCLDFFGGYVGKSYEESIYEISVVFPKEESWLNGTKTVSCFAFDMELKQLSESIFESGQ